MVDILCALSNGLSKEHFSMVQFTDFNKKKKKKKKKTDWQV